MRSPAWRGSTPHLQVLEAVKELITEANFEVSGGGITLQAMDSSHVSLVALSLRSDGFEHFRADRSFSMGMNLNNMVRAAAWRGRRTGSVACAWRGAAVEAIWAAAASIPPRLGALTGLFRSWRRPRCSSAPQTTM